MYIYIYIIYIYIYIYTYINLISSLLLCFTFRQNLKQNIVEERTIMFLTVDTSIEDISERQGMRAV